MIPTRTVDKETHVAGILLKSQAALEELHRYYKFERHGQVFPEKLYFLLSHCAQLLFSLWLAENESPSGIFGYNTPLEEFVSELDFGALRYIDYKRRTLHGDAYEEHLKNEPNWFKFWLRAMQKQSGTKTSEYDRLAQEVLSYANDPAFLEGKVPRSRKKALADLTRMDAVARLLTRSITVMEQMTSAIILQFANLDQAVHTTEQIASLLCMLRQARLTIVNESVAEGPYLPFANKNWGIPSTLFHVHLARRPGRLKVVLKRDGGGVVCTYRWKSGTATKRRSWTRSTSALSRGYEEELFRTWSYDTGEPLNGLGSSTDSKTHWVLQNTEAKRLGIIFQHIERVVRVLTANPRCTALVADLERIMIDQHTDRHNAKLDWTYVQKLDRLLNSLNSAYREARVLGGVNPGQEVIAMMWPVRTTVDHETTAAPQPSSATTVAQPTPEKGIGTVAAENALTDEVAGITEPCAPTTPDTSTSPSTDSTCGSTSASRGQSDETLSMQEAQDNEKCGEPGLDFEPNPQIDAELSSEHLAEEPQITESPSTEKPVAEESDRQTSAPQPASEDPSDRVPAESGLSEEVTRSAPAYDLAVESVVDASQSMGPICVHQSAHPDQCDDALDMQKTGDAAGSDETRFSPERNECTEAELSQESPADEPQIVSAPTVGEVIAEESRDEAPAPQLLSAKITPMLAPETTAESGPLEDDSAEAIAGVTQAYGLKTEGDMEALPSADSTYSPESPSENQAGDVAGEQETQHAEDRDETRLNPDGNERDDTEASREYPGDEPQIAPTPSAEASIAEETSHEAFDVSYPSEQQQANTETVTQERTLESVERASDEHIEDTWQPDDPEREPDTNVCETSQSPGQTTLSDPYRTYFAKLAMRKTKSAKLKSSGSLGSRREAKSRPLQPTIRPDRLPAYRALLNKLIEHHNAITPPNGDCPLSLRRLAEDLGWKPYEVQRTMTDFFGRRPFSVYKQKCSEGGIGELLVAWRGDFLERQADGSEMLMAHTA